MKQMNGHHAYVFQSEEDARDAAKALKDGHVCVDTRTVWSMCKPQEAEQRLRLATVVVSGTNRDGNPTGEPKVKTCDLWSMLKVVLGPDGIDVELDRRIERAIEDGELERTKWRKGERS